MSERDLYKLFSEYDGEVDLSDFTVEELTRLLGRENERDRSYKEKYFSLLRRREEQFSEKTGLVKCGVRLLKSGRFFRLFATNHHKMCAA